MCTCPIVKKREQFKQRFFFAMGTPSIDDLKTIIQTNLVKDNQVTIEYIDQAEELFGPDIGNIKEKNTQNNIKAQKKFNISIPQESINKNRCVDLSIDIITINGIVLLTKISHEL